MALSDFLQKLQTVLEKLVEVMNSSKGEGPADEFKEHAKAAESKLKDATPAPQGPSPAKATESTAAAEPAPKEATASSEKIDRTLEHLNAARTNTPSNRAASDRKTADIKTTEEEGFGDLRSILQNIQALLATQGSITGGIAPKQATAPFGQVIGAFNAGLEKATQALNALNNPEKMIYQGEKRGGLFGRAQAATGYTIRGMERKEGTGQELESLADFTRAFGKIGGAAPGVGRTIEGFSKLGEGLMRSIDRLHRWTEQIHESNMRFAEWSPAMSRVMAEQMQRDIFYSQERGERRAPLAAHHARTMSDLRGHLGLWEDVGTGIKEKIGDWFTDNLVNPILRKFDPLGQAAMKYLNSGEDDKKFGTMFDALLQQAGYQTHIAATHHAELHNKEGRPGWAAGVGLAAMGSPVGGAAAVGTSPITG